MKLIKNFVIVLCVLFFVWIFMSHAEVVISNRNPNPTYSNYNFFVLIS